MRIGFYLFIFIDYVILNDTTFIFDDYINADMSNKINVTNENY